MSSDELRHQQQKAQPVNHETPPRARATAPLQLSPQFSLLTVSKNKGKACSALQKNKELNYSSTQEDNDERGPTRKDQRHTSGHTS